MLIRVDSDRRGSALLIVLGFLSFMVVSAVAFSVFMRSERVPSSALRSGVTTRHLMKAALARAISRVDVAIGSDPFPGVTGQDSIYAVSQFGAGNLMYDSWAGRVFMPPNPEADETSTSDGDTQDMDAKTHAYYALPEETVSVLNLEAMGYVPPMLINDVRYQSRRSWAAKWEPLDYDAGRYAFCAVNVSDFIDINRVDANTNRSSACRVSLAHLFQNVTDGNSPLVPKENPSVPFLSMMDYNLNFRGQQIDSMTSPFSKWIRGKAYQMSEISATDTLGVRYQFFVTDSWFPRGTSSATSDKTLYLDNYNENDSKRYGQPFRLSILKNCANASIRQVVQGSSTPFFNNLMMNKLARTDYLSLFDYLDRDDLPLSVALPCCERVPMVAGVSVESANVHLKFAANGTETSGEEAVGSKKTTITHYKFEENGIFNGGTAVLVAFPFKRLQELDQTFTVRTMVRVFLAEKTFNSVRGKNALEGLRPKEDEWDNPVQYKLKRSGIEGIVFTAVSSKKNITLPDKVEEGGENVTVSIPITPVLSSVPAQTVFSKKEEKSYVSDGQGGVKEGGTSISYKLVTKPFAADGKLYGPEDWIDSAGFTALSQVEFVPHVAVWVKITNGDGDVVDLVPALMDDDQEYGGQNNSSVASQWEGDSSSAPILRCAGDGDPFKYTANPEEMDRTFSTFKPQAYFAFDPRFNWMPEDFVAMDGKSATESEWWKLVKDELGVDGRDPDPFMFVSNQGYMQSMGELAFIPRGSDGFNASDQIGANSRSASANGEMRTSVDKLANYVSMFRTYRAYATGGKDSDNLFFRGVASDQWRILDSSSGFRVNPYSDLASIQVIPFSNTPTDWWVAGTNLTTCTGVNPKDITTKRKIITDPMNENDGGLAFAFNSTSGAKKRGSRLKDIQDKEKKGTNKNLPTEKDDDRIKIANAIYTELRKSTTSDGWENNYDNLTWDDDNLVDPGQLDSFRYFLGKKLSNDTDPLHSVDRKFLYAYWRGCFANRQQLFLIFVRAESSALGGSEGRTASQLGGRAVALVWRDPSAPSGTAEFTKDTSWDGANRKPHRTRILFYHQLD